VSPRGILRAVVVLALAAAGCDSCLGAPTPEPEATEGELSVDPELTLGLTPEIAQRRVAVVEGEEIRVLDVAYEIEAASPMVGARLGDAARRRALVERMVQDRALAAEARERGLDDDPRPARAREDFMVRALAEQVAADIPRPSEEEVRRFFDDNRDRYRNPPLRTVGLIFTRDRAAGEAAIARVQADPRHLNQMWHDIAREIGFMGPLWHPVQETEPFAATPRPNESIVPQPIRDIAFAGEPGNLHPELVPHADGWYLVRIMTAVDASDVPFGDVRAMIEQELHEAAAEQALTALVAEQLASATLDDEALETVRVPVWAPLAGGETAAP